MAWLLTLARAAASITCGAATEATTHPEPETLVQDSGDALANPSHLLATAERDAICWPAGAARTAVPGSSSVCLLRGSRMTKSRSRHVLRWHRQVSHPAARSAVCVRCWPAMRRW